ncbi:Glycosyl transferase family 2 [Kaistella chaponensis]|uniref:Glycosyl transferase family 2 n=1 Tax=Kaistella chaponensis TaxID=713588 RepID=A0A1N7J611_9FLAO|nr:glycosyltransferase family 2 protein [Kaistella chaponensis]SIS44744.1 Glycosyl transferase family 2 [Kaistella chaponensis]
MSPKISIITINYNNREGLERTFDSVFSQNYTNFEYIVIDGASNDGSKELIDQFSDKITFWVSEPDKGIYNAMNKGIDQVNGDYVFFLNSGDIFLNSNSLETVSKELHTEDIIYFNIQVVGENREFVKKCPQQLDFEFLYKGTLPHQSTFMKTETFKIVGKYDEKISIVADWKWFLVAVCNYNLKFRNVEEIISIYYLDGISADEKSRPIIKKERREILENSVPFLLFEYENRIKAENKIEGYESSRAVSFLKKIGFLKGL